MIAAQRVSVFLFREDSPCRAGGILDEREESAIDATRAVSGLALVPFAGSFWIRAGAGSAAGRQSLNVTQPWRRGTRAIALSRAPELPFWFWLAVNVGEEVSCRRLTQGRQPLCAVT
jgi:hypothetical protein